jgi:uncharacterized membrane protein YkoI
MDANDRDRSDRAGGARRERGRSTPIGELKVTTIVEETEPGSALDERLRREQAKAVFDLLRAAARNRSKPPQR